MGSCAYLEEIPPARCAVRGFFVPCILDSNKTTQGSSHVAAARVACWARHTDTRNSVKTYSYTLGLPQTERERDEQGDRWPTLLEMEAGRIEQKTGSHSKARAERLSCCLGRSAHCSVVN